MELEAAISTVGAFIYSDFSELGGELEIVSENKDLLLNLRKVYDEQGIGSYKIYCKRINTIWNADSDTTKYKLTLGLDKQ